MKQAAIYVRVSTDRQAQEGDSISAQLSALHKYIDERPDMICAGEYIDDGISGTRNDRDELVRLLEDVKAGKVNCVLFTKLDRWFRSIRHYTATQEILDRHNVTWTAIWEPIYDTSTPQGRLIVNQMMSIAQFEAENTGQRIRQVQAYKVTQGEVISGSTPPGLKIVDKHLVPDENAEDVRMVFEHYAYTGSLAGTLRYAEQFGCFPRTQASFKKILQNEKYTGQYRGNEHFCEPIIDKSLFDDVQRKLGMNVKKSQKKDYIFSGLLICAECGNHMASCTYTDCRNGHKHKMYRCAKRYAARLKDCANTKAMYERVMERYLLERIKPMIEGIILDVEIESRPAKNTQAQRRKIEKKLDRLKDLYINEGISLAEYKADKEALQAELDNIPTEAPKRDTEALKRLLDTDIISLYGTFTDAEKRVFWRSIIKEIRFGIDRHIEVVFL